MRNLKGQHDEALKEAKAAFSVLELTPVFEAMSGGFETGGYRGTMLAMADTLAAVWQQSFFAPTMNAEAYVAAGEKEKAIEWVEKAYEIGDPNMPYWGGSGITQTFLRDDPRCQELLRKMKLPLPKV